MSSVMTSGCPKRSEGGCPCRNEDEHRPSPTASQTSPKESGGGRLHRLSEYPRSFVSPNRNEKKRGNPAVRCGHYPHAIAIAVSIALHEVGHLVPAKLFNVRVPQYMIGFGKTVFSFRRGETEYGFKAIPLGGYISMIGMYRRAPPRCRSTIRRVIRGVRALRVPG